MEEEEPMLSGNILDTDSTVTKLVMSGLMTIVVGAVGLLIKRNRTSQTLEDTTNTVTVETLTSARIRITELEVQVRALLAEISDATKAQIASESAAQRAAVQAELASEAAARAHEAAVRSRAEADEAQRLLRTTQAYASQLKAAMIAADMEVPPEPEL